MFSLMEKFKQVLNESTELTKKQSEDFMRKLINGDYDEDYPGLLLVNTNPEKKNIKQYIKQFGQNTKKYIKDVNELKDKDLPDVVGIIKTAEGKIVPYDNKNLNTSNFGEASTEEIIKNLTGKEIRCHSAKICKVDGVYEYVYKGKGGEKIEETVDLVELLKIIQKSSYADLWFDIPVELEDILYTNNSKRIENSEWKTLKYELYHLGKLNTKTKLKFDDVVQANMNDNYRAYEIADLLVIDRTKKKYMSVSLKKDTGTVTIGGIEFSDVQRAFKDYKADGIAKILGIEKSYIENLTKMIVQNKPIKLNNKFAEPGKIVDEEQLSNFLASLTSMIYRYGYLLIEANSEGKISTDYAVRKDFEHNIQIRKTAFSKLSKNKMERFLKDGIITKPKQDEFWSLGYKIQFTMNGRKYCWDFRNHTGQKAELTVATVKRESAEMRCGTMMNEGGNAKTATGENASKVDIASMGKDKYNSYRMDIVKLVKSISRAFRKTTGEKLFPNEGAIDSCEIFSGSGNSFFKQDYEKYTKVKPKLGDIDVQVDITKKEKIRKFLDANVGKLFNGFKYLGNSGTDDIFNVFEAPEKYRPEATNIQIDFEFIEFDENGNPNEFDIFAKNSEWEDISVGIKGLAKNELIPCIYKVIYGKEGVLFQNKRDIPSKNQGTGLFPSLSYGKKGTRSKYRPVIGADGKQVMYNGKPAFREYGVKETGTNKNLESIFEEMFKHKPTVDEKKKFYNYQGLLELMKENYSKDTIQRIYDVYVPWVAAKCDDLGVFKRINEKFKEFFPYVKMNTADVETLIRKK